MADPAESASAADPESWSDNQPEDSAQEFAVVDLPEPRDQKTKNGRVAWALHGYFGVVSGAATTAPGHL